MGTVAALGGTVYASTGADLNAVQLARTRHATWTVSPKPKDLFCVQGDSAVWQGTYSWDVGAFVGNGATFHFPRSAACEPAYCSVEAVGWLDDARIVAASGAADASQVSGIVGFSEFR